MVDLDTEAQPGRIVVAVIEDQTYVKRLRIRRDRPRLESADRTLVSGDPRVVGVVVEIRRSLE